MAVVFGIVPAVCLAAIASSQNHWRQWLERLGVNQLWGAQVSPVQPAAKWLGNGKADFGQICVVCYDPASSLIHETSFRLKVTTVFNDPQDFERFIRAFGHLVRDEVLVTVRASSFSELQNPEYMAKKVLTRVNRVLGEPVLKSATLENFAVFERSIQKAGSLDGPK